MKKLLTWYSFPWIYFYTFFDNVHQRFLLVQTRVISKVRVIVTQIIYHTLWVRLLEELGQPFSHGILRLFLDSWVLLQQTVVLNLGEHLKENCSYWVHIAFEERIGQVVFPVSLLEDLWAPIYCCEAYKTLNFERLRRTIVNQVGFDFRF